MKKSLSAPLRPAPRAGQRPAAGGYRLAQAVLGRKGGRSPAPASSTSTASEAAPAAFEGDADVFLIEDLSTGEVQQVPKRDYLIGAAAAEMPLTWPDEALKARIVAAHSYALLPRPRLCSQRQLALCRPGAAAGLPDRRRPPQLLGTDYRANYVRLSASRTPSQRRPLL